MIIVHLILQINKQTRCKTLLFNFLLSLAVQLQALGKHKGRSHLVKTTGESSRKIKHRCLKKNYLVIATVSEKLSSKYKSRIWDKSTTKHQKSLSKIFYISVEHQLHLLGKISLWNGSCSFCAGQLVSLC